MFRKVLSALIIGVIVLGLAGCGSGAGHKVLCEPKLEFEQTRGFSSGYAAVYKEGKWGYIDKTGKLVIPYTFDYAESFAGSYAVVQLNGGASAGSRTPLYGLIDKKGKPLAGVEYQLISDAKEGLYVVGKDGKFGYIDKKGKLVIPCEYDIAYEFCEGLAVAAKDNMYGYIDKTGKNIIPFQYEYAYSFTEGLAAVYENGKHGYIDASGTLAVPFLYDGASFFSGGLALVAQGEYPEMMMGYIDKSGNVVIPFEYIVADDFSSGVAQVQKPGEYVLRYINTSGEVVVRCEDYEMMYSFSEGLAAVRILDKWGAIDASGKLVIANEYEWLDEGGFSGGIIKAKKDAKWGYIDTKGQVVMAFEFDELSEIIDGYAAACISGKFGVVDKSGRIIAPFEYEFIGYISEGLAFTQEGGKWGIIQLR